MIARGARGHLSRLQRRELLLAHLRTDGLGSERRFHRLPPIRLCWGWGPGFRPDAGRVPQRAGHRAVPSRFLAKGRGVIELLLQQRQVAIRVTRFQRFFLLAVRFQQAPAPVTCGNPRGVTCHASSRCRRQRGTLSRVKGSDSSGRAPDPP